MFPPSIKTSNHLTEQELIALQHLVDVCSKHDGSKTKIYWEIISKKRDIMGNFLCYRKNTLIAYFSFFLFNDDAVHVSALVHPAHRRQKIFINLLQNACPEIIKLGVNKIIFSFPKKNEMSKACLISLGGQFLYAEYQMERLGSHHETIEDTLLSIKKAGENDIELMARIDASCFNSDPSIMLERFKHNMMETDRQVWLAYLGNNCIGKAHIHFDKEKAFIHDVGILPAYQKRGYGTMLLKFIINQLINNDGCHHMYLEVETKNESALQLYKKCHFDITNIYEYWYVNITIPEKICTSVHMEK